MIRTAIIGAAGLSGLELIRILSHHPEVKLEAIPTSSIPWTMISRSDSLDLFEGRMAIVLSVL